MSLYWSPVLIVTADSEKSQTTPAPGVACYAIDTQQSYRYSGSAWENITRRFALQVLAANASTTTDGQTIYFGGLAGLAPSTTGGNQPIYCPCAGTIKTAYVFANAGTAGTNEAWSLYLRKNNTSDTLIASVSASTATRTWSNTNLSIPVSQGDFIEIKSTNPTWATNPANVRFGGSLYLEV